jgi:exopolyphosphatase/guanosine-5'-triphosphate,3'-diphosphate pyrophosphatase
MTKYASIDIGSNTLLLLVADEREGELHSIVDKCEFARLGQGMATSSSLHPDAIERSLTILGRYREELDGQGGLTIGCVATQAIREADNSADFLRPAEQILGASIEVIEGAREASLVARAVVNSFPDLCRQELVVVDVGGGSTEFVHIKDRKLVYLKSIPIGAVRLSERYLHSDPATDDESRQLATAIDTEVRALDLPSGILVVGTAGTATTIASLKLKLESYQPERIHGLRLSPHEVESTLAGLLSATLAEKKQLRGLEPKRAEVIAAGVSIYARVLDILATDEFVICDRGVRWGLLYELAGR